MEIELRKGDQWLHTSCTIRQYEELKDTLKPYGVTVRILDTRRTHAQTA